MEAEVLVDERTSEGGMDTSDFHESGTEDGGNPSIPSSNENQLDPAGLEPLNTESRRLQSQSESEGIMSSEALEASLGDRVRSQSISIPVDPLAMKRRSSRSIKRRRFDDEIVESSLNLTPNKSPKGTQRPATLSVSNELAIPGPSALPSVPVEVRRRPPKSSRRPKRSRHSQPMAAKDLGRWKPIDDLALITAVLQTSDLNVVRLGVKFSCHFTLAEITERWYALMYDAAISRLAISAIRNLHPVMVATVQGRTLYSKAEEDLLRSIPANSQPSVEKFQQVLNENPHVFHYMRSPKVLYNHWQMMKQYHLLPNQTVQPVPKGDNVLSFSDAEDQLDDIELSEPADDMVERELMLNDRRCKREIRLLENETSRWQVQVDSVTGISSPDFDSPTLAVLRGRLVRYLMRSREITLGRATANSQVDVDLSLEGPAWKISRRQGSIKLRTSGDFFLANEGKRPIYVDGRPVLSGNKIKLVNNSVIEVASLRFIFLVNQDLIATIRQEAAKMSLQ